MKTVLNKLAASGLEDVLIRTAKTAVAAFAAICIKQGIGNGVQVYAAALDAAYIAGVTFVMNAALTWAAS